MTRRSSDSAASCKLKPLRVTCGRPNVLRPSSVSGTARVKAQAPCFFGQLRRLPASLYRGGHGQRLYVVPFMLFVSSRSELRLGTVLIAKCAFQFGEKL